MSVKTKAKKAKGTPSWFPLKIYNKNLTADEWAQHICVRGALRHAVNNLSKREAPYNLIKDTSAKTEHVLEDMFKYFILDQKGAEHLKVDEGLPIRSLTTFDAILLAEPFVGSKKYKKIWETARAYYHNESSDTKEKHLAHYLKISPAMDGFKRNVRSFMKEGLHGKHSKLLLEALTGFPITVDLFYDDETLKEAFSVYLSMLRDTLGFPKGKVLPIKKSDLAKWTAYKVLPLFDLEIWAQIKGEKYTDARLAQILWPAEEFKEDEASDPIERLRKTARPKSREVISNFMLTRLKKKGKMTKQMLKKLRHEESGNKTK